MRSGFVAVVGRTNVGKSTLVNGLVGEKVAIVTPKPQTTRNVIRGILNEARGQVVFLDTPGLHKPRTRMNQTMVRQALESVEGVDAVLWMVDALHPWQAEEERLAAHLGEAGRPTVVAVNKIDTLGSRESVLPVLSDLAARLPGCTLYPLSALDPSHFPGLLDLLFPLLPEGEPLFPSELYTDQPERQLVAEVVREHVFSHTFQEVPHCVGVLVESFEEAAQEGGKVTLHCAILVERESQKPILIGKGGQNLKAIGMGARKELQRILGCGVELRLFVKVRPDWREDASILREMGLA
ncbi:MAG: GTPase Era [Acidobacteriota bacterium]